jgi:hypothetical protein
MFPAAGELTGNETAIKMLLHYYRELLNDNNRLKNESNTLKTYVDAYDRNKSNSATGSILLGVSNISVGFGVNLLTGTPTQLWPGVSGQHRANPLTSFVRTSSGVRLA